MDLRSPFITLTEAYYREALELLPAHSRFSVRSALYAVHECLQTYGSQVSSLGVRTNFASDFAARLMERARYLTSGRTYYDLNKLSDGFVRDYFGLRDGIEARGGEPGRAKTFFKLFEECVDSHESVEASTRLESQLNEFMARRDNVALPHSLRLEDLKAYRRVTDELFADAEFARAFGHTEEKLELLRAENTRLIEELEIDLAPVHNLIDGQYRIPNLYRELVQNFTIKSAELVTDRSKYATVRNAIIAFSVLFSKLGRRYTVQTIASAVESLSRELVTIGGVNQLKIDSLAQQYLSDIQWLNDFETQLRAGVDDHFTSVCEIFGANEKAKQLQLDKLDLLRLQVRDSNSLLRYIAGYEVLVKHQSFADVGQEAKRKLGNTLDQLEVVAMEQELEEA